MSDTETTDDSLMLEPCDVFLTRGSGVVSRAIRWFTRHIGESRTEVNHVGLVVGAGSVHSAIIVEALSKVKRHELGRYAKQRSTSVAVYRPKNLTESDTAAIVLKANSYVDRRYGFVKLATHLADWALQGAYVFRRLTDDDNYPICSWVVAHSYAAADKNFGVAAGAASPDDIWDFVIANPDKFDQIRPLTPLPEPPPSVTPR